MLWAEGGPARWPALLITTAGLVFTADIPLAILSILAKNLHIGTAGILEKILTVLLIRPASLILLMVAIFYLWMYFTRSRRGSPTLLEDISPMNPDSI
jgi:hypothetical protein